MFWSLAHRVRIVELYSKTESIVKAQREFRKEQKCKEAPHKSTILRLIKRFRKTGSIRRKEYSKRLSPRRQEAVGKIGRAIEGNRRTSVRKLSVQTQVPRSSVSRILHQDLGLYPYKVQLVQKLLRGDKAKRWEFSRWFLEQCESHANFAELIFRSDEAKFHLNGTVNKQNCRIWSTENPDVFQEAEMHPPFVMVWCAVSAKAIIGPYFFEDGNEPVAVNASRYCQMIEQFFIPALRQQRIPVRKIWFQQDGATAHTSTRTINLLKDHFQSRIISKNGPVNWPPRSPDLTASDFFLWGYIKSKVYSQPISSVRQLKNRIRRCIRNIPIATTKAAMVEALPARCQECVRRHGGHLADVIFRG